MGTQGNGVPILIGLFCRGTPGRPDAISMFDLFIVNTWPVLTKLHVFRHHNSVYYFIQVIRHRFLPRCFLCFCETGSVRRVRRVLTCRTRLPVCIERRAREFHKPSWQRQLFALETPRRRRFLAVWCRRKCWFWMARA